MNINTKYSKKIANFKKEPEPFGLQRNRLINVMAELKCLCTEFRALFLFPFKIYALVTRYIRTKTGEM